MKVKAEWTRTFGPLVATAGLLAAVLFLPAAAGAAVAYEELPGVTAGLSYPEDVAVSPGGRVYVADSKRNLVLVYDRRGVETGRIAVPAPGAVAVNPDGTVYVVDGVDRSVRFFTTSGDSGVLGQGSGEFRAPENIFVDKAGMVYVVDSSTASIRLYTAGGGFVKALSGQEAGSASFTLPIDVAVFGNEIYVLDQPLIDDGSGGRIHGSRIQVLDMNGRLLRSFGSYGGGASQFIRVKGLTVDLEGRVFVSDSLKRVVKAFTPTGTYLGDLVANPVMEGPRGVTVSSSNRLMVAAPFSKKVFSFGLFLADGSAPWSNLEPTAVAGPEQTVREGETVTLDGSASSDDDGSISGYAWTQVSGPAVTLSGATLVQPTFTAPQVGGAGAELVFSLQVTDDQGLVGPAATTSVHVQNILSGSLAVNGGASYTASRSVTLASVAEDAVKMRFANGVAPTGDWLPFTASHAWQLADGDGEKTVYAEFEDAGGNRASASDAVILDTTPPGGSTGAYSGNGSGSVSWSPVAGSSGYRLQYADNPQFTGASLLDSLSLTNHVFEGLADGTWYWRVQAVDEAGNGGEWSETEFFLVGDVGACSAPPAAPVLRSPVDGESLENSTPDLKVHKFSGDKNCASAWQTQWQVKGAGGAAVLEALRSDGADQLWLPPLLLQPGAAIIWRVRYVSVEDTWSTWAAASSFNVPAPSGDQNENGVPDNQDVDASVDLDNDGTADIWQTGMLSARLPGKGGMVGVKVVGEAGTAASAVIEGLSLTESRALRATSAPKEIEAMAAVRLRAATPGASVKIIVHRSIPFVAGSGLPTYGLSSGWQLFAGDMKPGDDGLSVAMTLIDGGAGDADGVANGVIVHYLGLLEDKSRPAAPGRRLGR